MDEWGTSVRLSGSNNFVVTGWTNSNDGDVTGYHGGTDNWVFEIDDSGDLQWQKCIGGSDEDVSESSLFYINNNYLVAGWTASNDGDVSGNNGEEDAWIVKLIDPVFINEFDKETNIQSTPNPFSTSTTIEYELKQLEKVSLMIYNQMGKQVFQTEENQSQGKQQQIWNAEGYADGVYYYRLQVGEQVANGKLVKVRR